MPTNIGLVGKIRPHKIYAILGTDNSKNNIGTLEDNLDHQASTSAQSSKNKKQKQASKQTDKKH